MASNTALIISREYSERVKKKSFIFTTLLMPLLMLALMVAPTLIMMYSSDDSKVFTVIDRSGVIAPQLHSDDDLKLQAFDIDLDVALGDETVDGVILIPEDVVKTDAGVKIYSSDALGMATETAITSMLDKAIETERLKNYEIDNLDKIMEQVKSDVKVQTLRTDRGDGEQSSSTTVSFVLGEVLNFLLYMVLLIYGQMVMTSIIEEKNNRVLELVVTSVKPTRLMLGKICGIGLVALTQIVIWLVLIVAMSAAVLPMLIPADIMTEVNAMGAGTLDAATATTDLDLLQAMSVLADPWYILQLFIYLIIFLVGGFLIYAAMFAAIGSAVDNIQDASQLQTVIVMPIIFGIIFGMQAAAAPNSTLAVVMSMIPLTSPMVMMARIPFGIPSWEIALSIALLVAGIALMVWIAAKVYRVGIFMYGKKPTFKEIIRWARYK